METTKQRQPTLEKTVLSARQLLEHWQGHRRLTRKLIEAFPASHFFSYALGGMRPCSELMAEILGMTGPGLRGVATGQWEGFQKLPATPRSRC